MTILFPFAAVTGQEQAKRALLCALASDEIRRHGLNQEKRTRLIKAGAQLIIPDFSQGRLLADFLFHPRSLPDTPSKAAHSQAAR